MSDNSQEYIDEEQEQSQQPSHSSKKRPIDEVEGEINAHDVFKKVLKSADSYTSDSNNCTFLRLGTTRFLPLLIYIEADPSTFGSKDFI